MTANMFTVINTFKIVKKKIEQANDKINSHTKLDFQIC